MSQQLQLLGILKYLPDDIELREPVINRAIDVRSACMVYLAINIRHFATPGGLVGKHIHWFI